MAWEPRCSVVRILGPNSSTDHTGTAGSGFIVAGPHSPLVITCSHVITGGARSGPGLQVDFAVDLNGDGKEELAVRARVDPELWTDPGAEDIAVLRPLAE